MSVSLDLAGGNLPAKTKKERISYFSFIEQGLKVVGLKNRVGHIYPMIMVVSGYLHLHLHC